MYKVLGLILIMCLLTGCGNIMDIVGITEAHNTPENGILSLNEEVNLNYEVPLSVPSIMVNQVGYRKESNKIAIFRGEKLPEYFYIIDATSGKQVFTGKLESKGYNSIMEEYNSYGVFTGLELVGSYYIETDVVGQSYRFSIGNNLYESVFQNACARYTQNPEQNNELSLEDTCYILTNLMSAYELYGEEFEKNTPDFLEAMKVYTDRLMASQDKKTGKLEDTLSDTPDTITAHGAGVLGKFSYVYSEYDVTYANECYTAARKAWNYAQKNSKLVEADDLFFGAAELYRLSGNKVYHDAVKEYIEDKSLLKTGNTDLSFYGEVTYLNTQKKVDTELCSIAIKRIMTETEEISEKSREEKYLTCINKEQSNLQEVLDSMVKMAVVDYVITNHEYATVLENHLHYFLGRNPGSVSFIKDFGVTQTGKDELDILSNSKYNSAFIFMMSAILSHEKDGE